MVIYASLLHRLLRSTGYVLILSLIPKDIPRSILGQVISPDGLGWGRQQNEIVGRENGGEADGGRAALIPVPNGTLSRQRGYLQRHLSMSLSGATSAYECGF